MSDIIYIPDVIEPEKAIKIFIDQLLGKDLSSLTDIRKDETDGILSVATLGASSVVKGVVKSLKKAGEELEE